MRAQREALKKVKTLMFHMNNINSIFRVQVLVLKRRNPISFVSLVDVHGTNSGHSSAVVEIRIYLIGSYFDWIGFNHG